MGRSRAHGVRVINPLKHNRQTQPFLSPLGRRRRLPAAVAPLAVTVVGGIALVVAFGALLGGRVGDPLPRPAAFEQEAAAQPAQTLPAATPDAASPAAGTPPAGSARAALTAPMRSIEVEAPTEADPASTAAIVPEPISPSVAVDVPVAESEADIATLEAIQQDTDDDPDADAQPQDGDEPAVAQATTSARTATPALRGARVRQAVNLRAAPDNDGRVLMVLPGGAEVEAQADCGWCAVRYRGSNGFVYKSFLDYR